MSKKKQPQVSREKKRGPISWVVNLLMTPVIIVLLYLAGSIIVGVLVEWGGMAGGFWDSKHAERVLRQEFAYLGNNFSTTLFGVSAEDAALYVIHALNSWFVGANHASSATDMISEQAGKSLGNWSVAYINAAVYIIMITVIRSVIIVLSVALFLIVGIAACVDGLHVRELRRVGGDDEHADVYHWAKASIPQIIIFSPMLYLAWPGAINPNFILLPGMFLFFVAIFQVFSKYKKVL